jgi:hypothetical protein
MKKNSLQIVKIFAAIIVMTSMYSCASTKPTMSPTDVKLMTTKQYDAPYEMVFKSAMSLLQSEQFVISQTDMESGLINATKRIQNKNADLNRALWGFSKDAATAKAAIIVDKVNDELTEIKLTVYEGTESSSAGGWGTVNKDVKEQMVYSPETYNKWFTSLSAEIERRKALR